ncbi:MAG: YfhO family protein, partial [Clostridia bacterium]|nr:YfhO family protein [Clostridia bacterium]
MNFSEIKRQTLLPQRERRLATFLIALGVAAALFVPYMILSEGYFTFFGDFNVQQIPFYQMCHAAVKRGDIGWNWLTDLGANFVGSYSFYLLGSPFFWLTVPFPNWFVPYLMGPLLILKFACAALTSYCYIRRFTKTPAAAQLGGLLYAFSGFSIYNIFFNHFHEPLIFFPLLLLALELLLTENRRGVFAVAVAVCAITNYFFFFVKVVALSRDVRVHFL